MRVARIGKMFNRKDEEGSPERGFRHQPQQILPRFRPDRSGQPESFPAPTFHGCGRSISAANRSASAKTKFSASSWRCRIFTPARPLSVSVPARRSRRTATSGRPTSARRPMSECLCTTPPPKPVCRARGDPAASVDNRTVGKNFGRCPSALAKGSGRPPEQREIPMALLSHISADVDRSYPSRFHPRGRRQRITEISRKNAGPAAFRRSDRSWRKPGRTSAPKTDRRRDLLYRAQAPRNSDKVCLAVTLLLGIGREVPGAFLVSIAANTNASDTAIGGCAQHAFTRKTTSSSMRSQSRCRDAARVGSPRCRWLDPLPSRYGNEARHPPL